MARRLEAVPTVFGDERDTVVTLKAPGKPRGQREHPALGPLPVRMNWLAEIHRLMRDQGLSLYEADQIVTEGMFENHDGKGRRFQPSHLR